MAQTIRLSQRDGSQPIRLGSDAKFLRGEDGFSPTVDVAEVEGGFVIAITDAKGVKEFFLPSGNALTDEQVQEAVSAYLAENPIEIDVADDVIEGDPRPVSSAAVHVELGNIDAILKTI